MKISFKNFFTIEALALALNRMAPLKTFVMDLVFPEPVRKRHPFDKLTQADLGLPSKNIPLITRGSASYALSPDPNAIRLIDPANLTPSITLSAADCNRIISLAPGAKQVLFDNYIDTLRKSVRKSTEALACQAITGKISYDLRVAEGVFDLYEVNFGAPKTVTIAKKWNEAGTNFGDIVAGIAAITGDLQESSDGTDIVHLVKTDVFAALANKAASNKDLIKVAEDHILVGTSKFYLCNSRYYSYKDKAYKEAIPDKTVLTIARDDAFSLFYCALDSFDASFAGAPFFVREQILGDPEGIKFIGQSRPMPVPNVQAIRRAQVLT
ncbi:MAG: major capsid protein [Treponema sp.]|jgi:hypothetical protein|nr:major capsid protein [Treponema sp.]